MESVLAHLARKERDRLRVARVDVAKRSDLAERFEVTEIPARVLLKEGHTIARIDGRTSAPRIEAMLESSLAPLAVA